MEAREKRLARERRQGRVRRRVRGTDERPRLCVYKSNRHMYAQVISDQSGRVLAAASTLKYEGKTGNRVAARRVGEFLGAVCQDRQIKRVVFDRNGFLYHGRVRELAEGARAAGLEF
jgi:large subunit ribosomal protein L18